MGKEILHWADKIAEKIIHTKGEKELYVCASGITPSGTVHIGNFREIISVDLVVKALRDKGKEVRFIYSWDDYDVFRKVPENMPNKDMLKQYIRKPIVSTPDPFGKEPSYARKNEVEIEKILPKVGIYPEFIYQSTNYKKSVYADRIKMALDKKNKIAEILNEHRTTALEDNWVPISIFCSNCMRDTTQIDNWDGDYKISYKCNSCEHNEEKDLRSADNIKLFWRIDWPMRWDYEKVDFEPAGKEHHSRGGSFDTASLISKEVYGFNPPVTFKYDFISIKGQGGKISSSLGNVISLADVLEIYQPEIVRYLFAGTRPDTEFSISFDLDVIKIYEDYDRCERIYYGLEEISEKKREKIKRIYELSQIEEILEEMTPQVPFRHLCNLLQIHSGNICDVVNTFKIKRINDSDRLSLRSKCAWNWVTNYAPDSFRFTLRDEDANPLNLKDVEKKMIYKLRDEIGRSFETFDEKSLSELFYSIAFKYNYEPKEFYKMVYRVLIEKEMGPRLANFILTIGKERIQKILESY